LAILNTFNGHVGVVFVGIHLRLAAASLKMYGSILGAVLLALQYSGDLFKQYAILSLDLSVALLIKLDGLLVAHRLLQQETR
jgi:hypothetical protein